MLGSERFQRFVRSFHRGVHDRDSLEDYDLTALRSLTGAEREAAEILLLERVQEGAEDPRAPRALAAMESDRAADTLRDVCAGQLPSGRETRVAAALALLLLTGEPAGQDAVANVLADTDGPWSARSAAANALAEFPGRSADEALLAAASSDPDGVVRAAAEQAFLRRHGLAAVATEPPLLPLLRSLTADSREERDAAVAELLTVVGR